MNAPPAQFVRLAIVHAKSLNRVHLPAQVEAHRPDRRLGETGIACRVQVNFLGAWSPLLSAKLGISDPTEPVRRQNALCDVRRQDRPAHNYIDSLGMIVDASNV